MPSVLNLLPGAASQPETQIFAGTVADTIAHGAPVTPVMPLHVSVEWNPSLVLTILDWPMLHGGRLPQGGDDVLIVVDDTRHQRCVWWGRNGGGQVNSAARWWRNAAASTQIGWSRVALDFRGYDDSQNFVNGTYFCPRYGTYQVDGQVELTVSASEVGISEVLQVQCAVYQNAGTSYGNEHASRGSTAVIPGTSVAAADMLVACNVSDSLRCQQGDYLELWVYTNAVVPLSVADIHFTQADTAVLGTGRSNYLSISQVLT